MRVRGVRRRRLVRVRRLARRRVPQGWQDALGVVRPKAPLSLRSVLETGANWVNFASLFGKKLAVEGTTAERI